MSREQKDFQRPDREKLLRILADNRDNLEGIVLRLAWKMGLSREEIRRLAWSDISFSDSQLILRDRTIPMDKDTRQVLEARYDFRGQVSPYVVISERRRTQILPESISRMARVALDKGGLPDISLTDLRRDFIICQLEAHGWPYTARISGIAPATLYAKFSAYMPPAKAAEPQSEEPSVDEFLMWRVLQAEGSSPVGLALWMTWKMGLQANEILSLTWEQVDFETNELHLADRCVPLGNTGRRLLLDTQAQNSGAADPHVLLTPNSRKPFDRVWLSKSVRSALIRGGMENATLRDIGVEARHKEDDEILIRYAVEKGSITKREVMAVLGLQKVAAYERLRRLTEQKRLVRVGAKYYVTGTVVPPEKQYEVLREYLEKAEGAYRQELAKLLHVEPRQCTVILKHLVEEGKLVQHGQQYYLPQVEMATVP